MANTQEKTRRRKKRKKNRQPRSPEAIEEAVRFLFSQKVPITAMMFVAGTLIDASINIHSFFFPGLLMITK